MLCKLPNMRFKAFLILILNFATASAQQIHLQCSVVDAQTGKPVPAAVISMFTRPDPSRRNPYWPPSPMPSKGTYFIADNLGRFDITTDKIRDTDAVTLSCLNYQTQIIRVSSIRPNAVIAIAPIIKTAYTSSSMLPVISVGSKKKTGKFDNTVADPGFDEALFMHGSAEMEGTVQTVGFYLCDGKGSTRGDATAPFRIRLFDIDTAGAPGRELTKELIIVSAKKGQAWFDVDISAYSIKTGCNGFYVALSALDSGFYKIKPGARTTDSYGQPSEYGVEEPNYDLVMPRLGTTTYEFGVPRAYRSISRGISNPYRHWIKEYFDRSYLIRATVKPDY